MTKELPKKWKTALKTLDIAFEPILNIHTAKTFAVEALLFNFREAGFDSKLAVFDAAYKDGLLYSIDIALREKALEKFTQIPEHKKIKLFYNLDSRLLEIPDFSTATTKAVLKKFEIKKENICFEISQRDNIISCSNLKEILEHFQSKNFCVAIDDFGTGSSTYKLLYETTPNIIKIDKFFLQNIQKDLKKQVLLRSITNLAILLGIQVVAQGVETKAELLICKDIGCHLFQGYFAQKPTLHIEDIKEEYQTIIDALSPKNRAYIYGRRYEPRHLIFSRKQGNRDCSRA